jgi:hypothetical protein
MHAQRESVSIFFCPLQISTLQLIIIISDESTATITTISFRIKHTVAYIWAVKKTPYRRGPEQSKVK